MSSKINDNVQALTAELIQSKLTDIMLNLALDMCDFHTSEPEGVNIPESISSLADKVRDYVKLLPDMLSKDMSERKEYINELNALAKEYAAACEPIFYYKTLVNSSGNYGLWQYKCKTAEKMPTDNYREIEASIRELADDFISGAESMPEKHYNMSRILNCIPLRMTRESLTDLIREGLKKVLEDGTVAEVDATLKLFKLEYAPMLAEGYGSIIPELKTLAEEVSSRHIDQLSEIDLEGYMEEIDHAIIQIDEVTDYLNIAYNDINYLIAILTFAVDEDYIINGDIVVGDIYHSCIEMVKTGDYDLYEEALAEKATDKIEENFRIIKDKENEFSEYGKKYGDKDVFTEETFSIVNMYFYIQELYMRELSDIAVTGAFSNTEKADEGYITKGIDGLIEFILSAPESISSNKNKFMRKELLSKLPVIMNEKEFNDYLSYAFEPLAGKNAGIVALTEIYDLLTEAGAIPDFETEHECDCGHHGHDHHHHHHDDDCDSCNCGHDHNHHHDHGHGCNCGHSHNHPHIHIVEDE